MPRVLRFPHRDFGRPASGGASVVQVLRGRARELLGRLLNRLGFPGAVRNVHIKDALTGQEIDVHVGALFTRITVNGRDYYFNRTTGKFDGTGTTS
jgi:hypothetical protein